MTGDMSDRTSTEWAVQLVDTGEVFGVRSYRDVAELVAKRARDEHDQKTALVQRTVTTTYGDWEPA